jgi:phosphatidylserine/phosphatidylglycerophosphate/cardiolipin synthase-like enzyme
MTLCSEAKTDIKLCAPYIKNSVVTDVFGNVQNGTSVDIVTKVNLRDFHNNASDINSLKQTLLHGGQVYNCSNLHAKVYIFDARLCVITSADLTQSGLSEFSI